MGLDIHFTDVRFRSKSVGSSATAACGEQAPPASPDARGPTDVGTTAMVACLEKRDKTHRPRLHINEDNKWLRSRDHALCAATLHVKLTLRGPSGEATLTTGVRRADLEWVPNTQRTHRRKDNTTPELARDIHKFHGRNLQSRFFGSLTCLYHATNGPAFLWLLLRLKDYMQKPMRWKTDPPERGNAFCSEMITRVVP